MYIKRTLNLDKWYLADALIQSIKSNKLIRSDK